MLSERVSQGMAARLAAAIMAIDMGNAHYLEAGAALSSRPSN